MLPYLLIALGVLGFAILVLHGLLESERTDEDPPGSGHYPEPSPVWQLNKLVYAEYTPRGRKMRAVLVGCLVALMVVLYLLTFRT